jgi:glucose-6-phosphate 1-dehydrogenase
VVPALFNLYLKKRLPENFQILGTATRAGTTGELRETCRQSLLEESGRTFNEKAWSDFSSRMTYQPADFSNPESYQKLNDILQSIESGPANRLYYLATPPDFFSPIVQGLAANKMLIESEGWRRVVIEKPFGSDLVSAKGLNHTLHEALDEKQIFRIDHYLGKETVQNILVARFANTIFEPVWNRNYIDSVQITVAETVGVESRGKYYDKAGVVRDMFQNHLLQLLTLVAMEPTSSYKADALRDEKVKVISAIRPVTGAEVERQTVRGQYLGYREEANVDIQSETATYPR